MEDNSARSVLIIEDDPLILDILVFKFKKKGWRVESALDGESGLQKASSKPEVILLDILLPGMNGYEVLKALKQDDITKSIPVLILSNYGQKDEIQKSLDLGAVNHLVKANVILDEVVTVVESMIVKSA